MAALFQNSLVEAVGAACVAGAFYYDLPLRWIEGSFALFCVAFSAGLGPVTYVYMPEVRRGRRLGSHRVSRGSLWSSHGVVHRARKLLRRKC